MKNQSRTMAAPYKETPHYRTPSESIANNYSPAAQDLKIKNLNRSPVKRISADTGHFIETENRNLKRKLPRFNNNNNNMSGNSQKYVHFITGEYLPFVFGVFL